jgi:hypothetical protein
MSQVDPVPRLDPMSNWFPKVSFLAVIARQCAGRPSNAPWNSFSNSRSVPERETLYATIVFCTVA